MQFEQFLGFFAFVFASSLFIGQATVQGDRKHGEKGGWHGKKRWSSAELKHIGGGAKSESSIQKSTNSGFLMNNYFVQIF